MNWAKGRATRGRGTSFKGACRYVLHDKGAATADRVGAVWLRNLATDDPDLAWREMMTLCDAADALKHRAGIKATGQKLSKPVYAFSLNWHEDDRPDPDHMRETAETALRALGLENQQALIVEHTDTPHRHVHIIVNLVDPVTGKSASLSNDGYKLDRWADRYEVEQGTIRSPDRRAKFAALEEGRKPSKRPGQASSREEWAATRRLKNQQAKERAEIIKAAYAERVRTMREEQSSAFDARRREGDRLWRNYQSDRKAIRDRYQPFLDSIYRSRRSGPPHPHTEQAMRDLQETAEWRELGRRLFAQRRIFNARERHLLGAIGNAIRLHHDALRRGDSSSLLRLALSGNRRRQAFGELENAAKEGLRKTQAQRRKARADVLRSARQHEIAERAAAFRQQRKALLDRHAVEISAGKALWRELAAQRAQVWSDFERDFRTGDRGRGGGDRQPARDQFNRAASGSDRDDNTPNGRGADDGGAGRSPPKPGNEHQRGAWRRRRSAEERKSDGSYKPRDRGGRDPGRTRRR